jgi:hypothetical protein
MKKAVAFLYIILGCIVLFWGSVAEARKPLVIWGKVVDSKGRPVAGSLVATPALSESTRANDQGAYRLVIQSKIKTGQKVVVVASREGFDYSRRSLTLSTGGAIKANFQLATIR